MMASTTGAQSVMGKTIAVYLEPEYATTFEGKENAVKADEIYSEANYIERTKKLMELGDAYVFFNGGTGTISEFAMCWVVARLYFGYHKPMLLYGSFWHKIIQVFVDNMRIRPDELRILHIIESPSELIDALEKFEDLIEQDRRIYIEDAGVEKYLMLGPRS
jgi:predicted Rossmann-fold nucleotide-binding protein